MGDGKQFHSRAWEDAVTASGREPSFQVADLTKGDRLVVETEKYRYEFMLIDPQHRSVIMTSDDPEIPDRSTGCIQGSAIVAGSTMRAGWIIEGYGLVIGCDALLPGYPVRDLPPTRRVTLNGVQVIPRQKIAS